MTNSKISVSYYNKRQYIDTCYLQITYQTKNDNNWNENIVWRSIVSNDIILRKKNVSKLFSALIIVFKRRFGDLF